MSRTFSLLVEREVLCVPNTVHLQVFEHGQAAGLAEEPHRRVGVHPGDLGDSGDIDVLGVIRGDVNGHPFELPKPPLYR